MGYIMFNSRKRIYTYLDDTEFTKDESPVKFWKIKANKYPNFKYNSKEYAESFSNIYTKCVYSVIVAMFSDQMDVDYYPKSLNS